ncbi:MAG: Sua5/YciO/YrdC/YwlC family protein, partial [Bacteroidales bacterium]|nr:Sua5/YciO/YrdC/YwlC family protein [Bacteroidales bacterium]
MEHIITQTVEALRLGKTILYPPDTIWGIGCDARNADAVEKI